METFYAILGNENGRYNVKKMDFTSRSQAISMAFIAAKELTSSMLGVYSQYETEELTEEIDYLARAHKHTMIYGLAPHGSRLENGNFWCEWQQEEIIFFHQEVTALIDVLKKALADTQPTDYTHLLLLDHTCRDQKLYH